MKLIYPSSGVLGFYDPLGQYIKINFSLKRFNEIIRNHNTMSSKDDMGLLMHESRHWIDQISTLRGRIELINVFDAFNSRLSNKYEEFWRIRHLIKGYYRNNPSAYFETFNNGVVKGRWTYKISGGLRPDNDGIFQDNDPIVFVSFKSENDDHIARVPIAIPSILETAAMHEEFQYEINVVSNVKDKKSRIKEMLILQEKAKGWLYEPSMALYSAAAHLVSGAFKITDVLTTLRISGTIANICLNIPEPCYDLIKIPEYCNLWGKKNIYLKEKRDIGFLFLCLVYNYVENGGSFENINIKQILSDSELPKEKDLLSLIDKEIENKRSNHYSGLLTSILDQHLKNGKIIYQKRRIDGNGFNLLNTLEQGKILPQIVFDDTILPKTEPSEALENCFKNSTLEPISKYNWIAVSEYLGEQCDEFNEVCGL